MAPNPAYKRALGIALLVNLAMFLIEIAAGAQAGSVSLWADAIDFAGDAANYGLSIWALGAAAVWGTRVAFWKGVAMLTFGTALMAKAAWLALYGGVPEANTMGAVGFLALVANVGVALLLMRWRNGDANMQAVWLCTRNDAIGNIAVMLAAGGVLLTRAAWPDLLVAVLMASLAVHSGQAVLRQARAEMAASA